MDKKLNDIFDNLNVEETQELLAGDIEMKIDNKTKENIKESVFKKAGLEAPQKTENERETKKEERKVINIMLMKKLVPIAAAFVFVIAATVVGVKFLGKDTPIVGPTGTDASAVVTDAPTEEDTTKAPVKGSNGEWEYLEYEASVTLTRYMAGNSGDKIVKIPEEINGKPVMDLAEEILEQFIQENPCDSPLFNDFISANSKFFTVVDNIVFNKNMTILFGYLDNFDVTKTYKTTYKIPDTVTRLWTGALGNFIGEKLIISANVREIGAASLPFSDSAISHELAAEKKLTSFTSLEVEDGNEYFVMVDDVLFSKDMKSLVFFPHYKNVETYTIPNGITTICGGAFYEASLKEISLSDSLLKIEDSAFEGCENLTGLVIPKSVKEIGLNAFSHCSNLTTVNIPHGITVINEGVFSGCISIENITIPNTVVSIGEYAFDRCDGLTNVVIPNSVKNIEYQAFGRCENLKSIVIPESVTSMDKFTFGFADYFELPTIYGTTGSYAETYAKENGITFVAQ